MEILVECVGYKDSTDRTYRLGELIVNPLFGDVMKLKKEITIGVD